MKPVQLYMPLLKAGPAKNLRAFGLEGLPFGFWGARALSSDRGPDEVAIEPGKRNELEVSIGGAPSFVEIRSLTLEVELGPAAGGPGEVTQVSTVKEDQKGGKTYTVDVALADVPPNVTLKIRGGDTLWNSGGKQARTFELPDLAEPVNAYLESLGPEAQLEEELVLPLEVETTTSGTISVRVKDRDLSYLRTHAFEVGDDGAPTVERTSILTVGQADEPVALAPLREQNGAALALRAIRADLIGAFDPERWLGPMMSREPIARVSLSEDYACAQGFLVGSDVALVGASVWLQAPDGGSVHAGIVVEGGAEGPLAAEGQVDVESTDGAGAWQFVRFEAPLDVKGGTPVTLVVRGAGGSFDVALVPHEDRDLASGPAGAPLASRGGGVWKTIPPRIVAPSALRAGLVHEPGPENPSHAVELELAPVGGGQATGIVQHLSPDSTPATIRLELDPGEHVEAAELRLRARGSGEVTLSNLIQEFEEPSA